MRPVLVKCISLAILCYAIACAARIYVREYFIWIPGYVERALKPVSTARGPVHVLFYFTDHFEPGVHHQRMKRWEQEYPALASRHRDSTGRALQHTWFYPGEQPDDFNMAALQRLVSAGYGEVEMHYHHANDTEASARRKFRSAVDYFQRFGFLRTIRGETRFAFIHGDSGLDNSIPGICGVNRELALLHELGCFADFTFPSLWTRAQPSHTNSIYDVVDDGLPKAYDRGTPVRVGYIPRGTLLLMQGPLSIVPTADPLHLFWVVEEPNLHTTVPLSPARVDAWVRAGVHVEGRPDWVFVKMHGHGASLPENVDRSLGSEFDRMLDYLQAHYNDGRRYVLHFVTAREAYNVVQAAAAGKDGDPTRYLDWAIGPYEADPRRNRPAFVNAGVVESKSSARVASQSSGGKQQSASPAGGS